MLTLVLLFSSLSAQPSEGAPALDVETASRHAIDDAAGLRGEEWATGQAPAPISVGDDARVKRFVGALAGGLVGGGLAMALLPLGDSGASSCGAFCSTVTPVHGVLATLAPLLAMTGAFTGWQLMGGDGAFLTTAAAMLPAGLLTALLLLVVPTDQSRIGAVLPELLTGLIVLSALSAVLLDWRENQREALGPLREEGSAPGVRVAAEVGMNLLGLATTSALVGVLLSTVANSGGPTGVIVSVAVGTVGVLGTALSTWGVHRGLHGRGSVVSSLLGLLLGAAVGGAVALIAALGTSGHFPSGDFGTIETVLGAEVATLAVLAASSIALEWSHTAIVGEREGLSLQLGGAPVAGGAMVAAGLRF